MPNQRRFFLDTMPRCRRYLLGELCYLSRYPTIPSSSPGTDLHDNLSSLQGASMDLHREPPGDTYLDHQSLDDTESGKHHIHRPKPECYHRTTADIARRLSLQRTTYLVVRPCRHLASNNNTERALFHQHNLLSSFFHCNYYL